MAAPLQNEAEVSPNSHRKVVLCSIAASIYGRGQYLDKSILIVSVC